jgi:hypothetical protein
MPSSSSNVDTRTFKQRKNFGKFFFFIIKNNFFLIVLKQHVKKKLLVFEVNFQIVGS